jgi:hypothetical protein
MEEDCAIVSHIHYCYDVDFLAPSTSLPGLPLFLSVWIAVTIFWQFLALILVVVYPVYEGREDPIKSARGIWNSFRNRGRWEIMDSWSVSNQWHFVL